MKQIRFDIGAATEPEILGVRLQYRASDGEWVNLQAADFGARPLHSLAGMVLTVALEEIRAEMGGGE